MGSGVGVIHACKGVGTQWGVGYELRGRPVLGESWIVGDEGA